MSHSTVSSLPVAGPAVHAASISVALDAHLLDVVIADRTRLAGPGLVVEAVQPALTEPVPLVADHRRMTAQPRGGRAVGFPAGGPNTVRQRRASAGVPFGRVAQRSSVSRFPANERLRALGDVAQNG